MSRPQSDAACHELCAHLLRQCVFAKRCRALLFDCHKLVACIMARSLRPAWLVGTLVLTHVSVAAARHLSRRAS
jgi:hypothetical protein